MSETPPPGWGEDSLSTFIQIAKENIYATYHNLKTEVGWLQAEDEIFKVAIDHLTNSPDWFTGFFLLRAHAAFLGATRLSMSCQLPETYMLLRGCLENALYGFYLHKNPGSRVTWLERHKDDATDKASREKVKAGFKPYFMHELLKTVNHNIGLSIDELYERTIDYGAHPNEKALSANMRRTQKDGFIQFDLNYLDKDSVATRFCLRTNAEVGIGALQVFGLIFQERFDILGLTVRIERLKERIGTVPISSL